MRSSIAVYSMIVRLTSHLSEQWVTQICQLYAK